MLEEGDAPGPATWADLPVEILEQILVLCDTPTLLSLGKIDHALNRLALDQLFKRENVTNPKQGYVVSRLAPKEVVPALNAALWIEHLPHVTYYLNPDVGRLFTEVQGIANLIERMPSNDRLDLYFSSVDRWFHDIISSRREGQDAHIPPKFWRSIFVTLLEVALRKGCRSMRVEGGHRLELHYVNRPLSKKVVPIIPNPITVLSSVPIQQVLESVAVQLTNSVVSQLTGSTVVVSLPAPKPTKPPLRRRLIRWIKKRLGIRALKPSPTAPISPTLASQPPSTPVPEPDVPHPHPPAPNPPPLLLPPPLPSVYPPVVTSPVPIIAPPPLPPSPAQSVMTYDSTILEESATTSFISTSPSLTTFNLRSSMMMQPLFFSDTINLVRNHSAVLRHLEIVSIKVPRPVWEKFFTSLTLPVLQEFIYLYDTLIVEQPFLTPQLLLDFFTRHPTLQMIELYGVSTTEDFPPVNTTLLPNLKSLNAHPQVISWLLQYPTSCPHLSFISLTSEYPASRLPMTDTTMSPYLTFDTGIITVSSLDRPVHVQFKFSTERDLRTWFNAHIIAGTTNTSPIQQLTKITNFTISSHYHTRFDENMKQLIPQWLKLFPNLKVLEMIELPFPDELKDARFIKAVKEAVPGLRTWVVGRDHVFGNKNAASR